MARVALLFSGLSRQWSHCIQSHLNLFKSNSADVFFHFWDTVDDQEKARIVDAYKPVAYTFAPEKDFSAMEAQVTVRDNINGPGRMITQYYGWYAVSSIFQDYVAKSGTKYDFAVRIRADVMFFEPLDACLGLLGPKDLLVSSHNNFGIINDMFALGGVEPVLYFMSMFQHVMRYKDELQFNSELLLVHHLNQRARDFRYIQAPIVMLAFRPHMVGMPIEECLKEHPGMSKWKDPEIVEAHKEFHRRVRGQAGEQHVEQFKAYQLMMLEQSKAPPPPPSAPSTSYMEISESTRSGLSGRPVT